eukprot:334225-Chlamydomonas_euryale.AAC.1
MVATSSALTLTTSRTGPSHAWTHVVARGGHGGDDIQNVVNRALRISVGMRGRGDQGLRLGHDAHQPTCPHNYSPYRPSLRLAVKKQSERQAPVPCAVKFSTCHFYSPPPFNPSRSLLHCLFWTH